MKNESTLITIISVITIALLIGAAVAIHSQSQTQNQKKTHRDDLPIADYFAILPADSTKRVQRLKRNRLRNMKFDTALGDPERFVITERTETTDLYIVPPFHSPAEPTIPAGQSVVVVIGKVKSANAFLSKDKTNIYSEFEVNINQVLKNTASNPLISENVVTVSRRGGAVRLPSGKIIEQPSAPKGMPKVDAKYIFFLGYDVEAEDYPIITAYELKAGKVIPLDGLGFDKEINESYLGQQSYAGMPEAEFLLLVQSAISTNDNVFWKRGEQ